MRLRRTADGAVTCAAGVLSPDTVRASGCDGKEPFAEPALAARTAARMRRRGRNVQHYRCPHCRAWHVGKPLRPLRKHP